MNSQTHRQAGATDLSRLFPQAHEDVDAMKMAARKIGERRIQGRQVAVGRKLAAPPTAATNDEIANLAAIDIDAEERAQTKIHCVHIGGGAMDVETLA